MITQLVVEQHRIFIGETIFSFAYSFKTII
jgi:hypothetical protein